MPEVSPGVKEILRQIELAFERRKARKAGSTPKKCQICQSDAQSLTDHHLIPKSLKRPNSSKTVKVCRMCHNEIHSRFSNEELGDKYFTLVYLKWALEFMPKPVK